VAAVVLDIPQDPKPATSSPQATQTESTAPLVQAIPVDTVRPSIESILDPDSALALLPTEEGGRVDWVEAIRSGVVEPRGLPPHTDQPASARFAYDFVMRGENEVFDADFPHSAHVDWLACESCHPTIYKYRDQPTTMQQISEGRSCGVCHGSVAFPSSACHRCHPMMPASDPVADTLGVDIVFSRDSSAGSGFPPAVFPHWIHRVRYRCSACHPAPFAHERGGTEIDKAEMQSGATCGLCHDGREAFALFDCNRCHTGQPTAEDGVG
jgi:c(7)-type cytochrome triheme protein